MNMSTGIRYRDPLLRRVLIEVSDPVEDGYSDNIIINLTFESIDDQSYFQTALVFSKIQFAMLGLTIKRIPADELEKLAKWLIINGSYRLDRNEIQIDPNAPGQLSYYVNHRGDFAFVHPPLIDLPVRESQVCRRAIISELYHAGTLTRSEIVDRTHMPQETANAEINGLLAHQEYLILNPDGRDLHFLSTRGREHYENSLRRRSGLAFIIAACHAYDRAGAVIEEKDTSHLKVLELYKQTLRDAGYDPKFQEHEEPQKNIYVDIFDYIDASEIVIADITWERPSCYIEIGYALARQKPTILFVEAEYFEIQMKKKLPFDLSLVKYQDYLYAEPEKLRKELEERVRVWRGRLT
jgi:hypothetical protein